MTNTTLDELSVRFHTCVRTGYEGKLALVLMCLQALQGADHLTTLSCIYTPYLQPSQVITHVPAVKNKKATGEIRVSNILLSVTPSKHRKKFVKTEELIT